jgi:hypothetical protein
MLVMEARWRTVGVGVVAFAAGAIVATVVSAGPSETGRVTSPATATPATPRPSPSVSPVTLVKIGGVLGALPDRTIHDPTLLPYPFMSPTPPPSPTAIDGTYLRTMTLHDVGGARVGLPFRCLRCPPFRIDAGVSTLIFTRGAYYLHHQLSGFRTRGSFVVEGDRVTLFNDANCPQTPGVYEFELTPHAIRFRVIEDDCPFSGERALDLMVRPWTHVSVCARRIQNLWPGEVAC